MQTLRHGGDGAHAEICPMTETISKRRYPEVHRAMCALMGERKQFKIIDHFASWLPRADEGLGALRKADADRWTVFVAGPDLEPILWVRDHHDDLRGAHQILDFMAN